MNLVAICSNKNYIKKTYRKINVESLFSHCCKTLIIEMIVSMDYNEYKHNYWRCNMKFENEKQIKDALGIDSWRNLSKEKIIKFAAMMPDMDKEVMMKIIDQFPEFRLFANDVLKNIEIAFTETMDANNENQKAIHSAFVELRRILEGQLEKDEISFEEKKYIIDKLLECIDKELQMDNENKKFLADMVNKRLTAAALVLVAAVVFVGGKVLLEKDND